MWVFGVATVLTLVLALALLAVVAIATGHLQGRRVARWEQVATTANRHLNGQGTPPKVFERLDHLREG